MKPIVKKYKYATLADYFEAEKKKQTVAAAPGRESDADTHQKMAERHNLQRNTINRIVNRLADPSYALAIAISKETGVALDGMGRSGRA